LIERSRGTLLERKRRRTHLMLVSLSFPSFDAIQLEARQLWRLKSPLREVMIHHHEATLLTLLWLPTPFELQDRDRAGPMKRWQERQRCTSSYRSRVDARGDGQAYVMEDHSLPVPTRLSAKETDSWREAGHGQNGDLADSERFCKYAEEVGFEREGKAMRNGQLRRASGGGGWYWKGRRMSRAMKNAPLISLSAGQEKLCRALR
jgi:hypothetical protein